MRLHCLPITIFSAQAGVDETGKLQGLKMRYVCDTGFSSSATTTFSAVSMAQNVYEATNWNVVPGHVNTNLAPNTWCRSPGKCAESGRGGELTNEQYGGVITAGFIF